MKLKKTALYLFARRIYLFVLRMCRKCFEKSKKDWPSKKRVDFLTRYYENKMGRKFDMYHPVLFTEKIQWYK